MKERLRDFINRFPGLKKIIKNILQAVFPGKFASSHYVEVDESNKASEAERLRMAWKDKAIPGKQRQLVERQILDYKNGKSNINFDILVQVLKAVEGCNKPLRVLEIGCSSGYYSEVFDLSGLETDYTGCDYSEEFISMARNLYPNHKFDVEDATSLGYKDNEYDIVISGCCLLHIPEYKKAITESARVAEKYIVFHRTPIVTGEKTKYYKKLAYGVETVEIHFNEDKLLRIFADNELAIVSSYTLNEDINNGVGSATRTYVCKKITV